MKEHSSNRSTTTLVITEPRSLRSMRSGEQASSHDDHHGLDKANSLYTPAGNDGKPRGSKEHPSARKASSIKQWLNYERKAELAGVKNARQLRPMKERSLLSQLNPTDTEGGCFAGCLVACGLKAKPVYLPPTPGEDVCGICHDNKPLLEISFCGHRTCILCAKSMCYMLDLHQLALCPFCGSLVVAFQLA